MPAAALRGALPAALRARRSACVTPPRHQPADPAPACGPRRSPSTRRTTSRPSAWTLCAAPRSSPRCGARSERGVLARATLRKIAPWRSTGSRSSSSWCARPPRARTTTRPHHHRPRGRQRRAAGISAHGCRLLLRAAVGYCRAGALPDDHEQLLPREPGHHDRVRRDRPPVRALGAPCLAVVGCRR